MSNVKLNQGLKRIEITGVEIESDLGFAYFQSLPEGERDEAFKRAFHIGVLALQQDRLSSFLARTKNELGTELESLKMMFDLNAEIYSRSAVKGAAAELEIASYLEDFVSSTGLKDEVTLTGNAAGAIPKNKTGDIVCTLSGGGERRIVIECKFDKGIALGKLSDRDWHGKNSDTAWGQLLESRANRDARQAIIVLDRSSVNPALLKSVCDVAYVSKVGFIVIVDSLRGKLDNLGIAYTIARDLALADRDANIDHDMLLLVIEKILSELSQITAIRDLVEKNITTSREILCRIEKGMLAVDFSRRYLSKVLADGTLSKEDLLEFYSGGDLKKRYLPIESEILALCSDEGAEPA